MKKSKFTETQIISILKETEAGLPVKGFAVGTVSAQPATTSGNPNTAG